MTRLLYHRTLPLGIIAGCNLPFFLYGFGNYFLNNLARQCGSAYTLRENLRYIIIIVSVWKKNIMNNANILNDTFYYLYQNDFIYSDVYFDGSPVEHDMSYGEYVAINEYMIDALFNEASDIYDFEKQIDFLREAVDSADDDTRLFVFLEDLEEMLDNIDEVEIENEDGYTECVIYKFNDYYMRDHKNDIPDNILSLYEAYEYNTISQYEDRIAA